MFEDIVGAKRLIDRQIRDGKIFMFGTPFGKYQKAYASTNENIKGYMDQLDFQEKSSALTVMASGDQVFNSIYYGISNIDTFDTNKLTEYYVLGIKRSAILAFSYEEYLMFMSKIQDSKTTLGELSELIRSLFPYMEEKHRFFWTEILDYNYYLQKNNIYPLNLMKMLLIHTDHDMKPGNEYLENEEAFNKLRTSLQKANIFFKRCNCLDLEYSFKGKYDFIFLSNIPDYYARTFGSFWDYKRLRRIIDSQKTLLKEDGILAIAYLFRYMNVQTRKIRTYPIIESSVEVKDFTNGEKILHFPHIANDHLCEDLHDGLLLERKRKLEIKM